eukprot:1366005-Rhodomonas_salina.4
MDPDGEKQSPALAQQRQPVPAIDSAHPARRNSKIVTRMPPRNKSLPLRKQNAIKRRLDRECCTWSALRALGNSSQERGRGSRQERTNGRGACGEKRREKGGRGMGTEGGARRDQRGERSEMRGEGRKEREERELRRGAR